MKRVIWNRCAGPVYRRRDKLLTSSYRGNSAKRAQRGGAGGHERVKLMRVARIEIAK